MSNTLKILFFIGCAVRVLSQRFWEYFDNPYIFYFGLAFFEITSLICIRSYVGKFKLLIDFFIVSAAYDLFKYCYLQPYEVSYNEDLGFIIGLVLIFIEYVFINYIKRR